MKRYVIFNHPIARIGFEQRESDNGEWVEYSDAIEAIKAERAACKNDIETVKKKYLFAGVCDDCIEAIDARSL